jgi:F420-dependent oxidoreductase-like protein
MKLGLNLGYWGRGGAPQEQLDLARDAEALGFDSLWAAEAYGSDAATVLAWLAHGTRTIKLGSAIFQLPARSAAMTAMTAATLDQLSGGRFRLGLGTSGPQVAEGWHGQRFARPLQRTRDYVAVVRLALARAPVEYRGPTLRLPLPDGPGKALRLTIAPVQRHLPIYLAALGPRNVALAGEIADGWLPVYFAPEHAPRLLAPLREGAARAGRSLAGFEVAPTVGLCLDPDRERARAALRPSLALYLGGMGSREQNFYNDLMGRYGFRAAARRVQDLYLAGERAAAAAALPAELIDLVTLCGPPDVVAERLARYRAAGVTTLIVSLQAVPPAARRRQLHLLAELAAPFRESAAAGAPSPPPGHTATP